MVMKVWGDVDRDNGYSRIHYPLPDGAICAYCRAPATTWDHIHPLHWGGADHPDNLTPACRPCNQRKGEQPVEVWRMSPAERKRWLHERGWRRRRELPRDPSDRHYALFAGQRFIIPRDSAELWFDPQTGRPYLIRLALRLEAFGRDARPTVTRRRLWW